MLRKSLVFILLFTVSSLVIFAQDAPKPDKNEVRKVFGFATVGGGSYMGVELKEVSKENFAQLGLSEVRGVAVGKVIKDSPADKAGLQVGDVIVRFNTENVTGTRQLIRMISEVAPDHKAILTVFRGGSETEISITMGKRPEPRLVTGDFEFPRMNIPPGEFPDVQRIPQPGKGEDNFIWRVYSGRSIGVGVTPLTDQLADYFGIKDGKGLLINRVSKDSPAERAGLRAGDVIIEIDGKKVSGNNDLIRRIYEQKEGNISLTIIRDKNRQTVTVTPEENKDGETSFTFEVPEPPKN